MYGEYDKSIGPKIALTMLHALGLCASAWLLLGNGLAVLARWTGRSLVPGHPLNRALVFGCAGIYFARICFNSFYLMRRKFGWGEAVGVGLYAACVHSFFAFLGSMNLEPLGWLTCVAAFLYFLGSYLNTGSEFLRKRWKDDSRHRGRLYTEGLFRYSQHINYFGDELLFIGYALLTGSPWALIVPGLMAFGFVFVNIPMLDAYLKKKYGGEFEAYALRTKKFVPYVY